MLHCYIDYMVSTGMLHRLYRLHGLYSVCTGVLHRLYTLFAQVCDIDPGISSPLLWLACSADRRVSVWSADWGRDLCDLVDWLTFPAPAFTPDGAQVKGKAQVGIDVF